MKVSLSPKMTSPIFLLFPQSFLSIYLLHLMTDLFWVFNFCKGWRNIVSNSSKLKAAHFLVPDEVPQGGRSISKKTTRLVPATPQDQGPQAIRRSGKHRIGRFRKARLPVTVLNELFFGELLSYDRPAYAKRTRQSRACLLYVDISQTF
ncbi:hypothetical protein BST61_g6581 [Cercospora zeina]